MRSYKYTDYSSVPADPNTFPARYTNSLPSSAQMTSVSAVGISPATVGEGYRGHAPKDIRKQVLPVKLSRMLSDPAFSHIISWMPHGRAWKVFRPRDFTEQVAPIYFEYPNYNSFIRLVNAWGFRRITTGSDTNAYFHELFLKDMPHLHQLMRRLSKNEKKMPLDPSEEPNFYKMPPLVDRSIEFQNQQTALLRNHQGMILNNQLLAQSSGAMLGSLSTAAIPLPTQKPCNLSSSIGPLSDKNDSSIHEKQLEELVAALRVRDATNLMAVNSITSPTLTASLSSSISALSENMFTDPNLLRLIRTMPSQVGHQVPSAPQAILPDVLPRLLMLQQQKKERERQQNQLILISMLRKQAQEENITREQNQAILQHQITNLLLNRNTAPSNQDATSITKKP